MDDNTASVLRDIPDKPPRSKLEPYTDVIGALRRKRHTYREIAKFLHEHLDLEVAPSTIHDFVRIRRRREKDMRTPAESQSPSKPKPTPQPEAVGVDERIAALKRRSSTVSQPKPLFVYDEDEPLKLVTKKIDDAGDA
jgi:IS30 family transposase